MCILNEKGLLIQECKLVNERLSDMNNKNISISEKLNFSRINNDEHIKKISNFTNIELNLKTQMVKIEDKTSRLIKEINISNNKLFDLNNQTESLKIEIENKEYKINKQNNIVINKNNDIEHLKIELNTQLTLNSEIKKELIFEKNNFIKIINKSEESYSISILENEKGHKKSLDCYENHKKIIIDEKNKIIDCLNLKYNNIYKDFEYYKNDSEYDKEKINSEYMLLKSQ